MILYKPKHVLIIIALSLICGYGLLWLLHHAFKFLIPNSEILIHILLYIIVYTTTAFVYSTPNILKIHKAFGIKLVKFKYVLLAVFLAILLWVLDYFYQIKVLNTNMLSEAISINNTIRNSRITSVFISMVIIAPMVEEILFRGIFLQTINNYLNNHWSAFIISLCFASIHFSLSLFPILFIASWVYVWLTLKTKSIIPAIIAHIINNSITFFYYIALLN